MISETHTPDKVNEIKCPTMDGQAARDTAAEVALTGARETEVETTLIGFDLFAEARRIYIRARSGQRVRSSNII